MRTCPRRQYFKRCILGVCPDVFVDKSTPTFGMHSQRGMRTCPRRQYFKRCILGVCHDVFVEKSTPTFEMHFNVGCGLVREGSISSDASSASAPTSSWTSPLLPLECILNVGCGLVREGSISNDASSVSATTSSWKSPLLPLECISTWDADLSAKAVFQAMHPRRLPRRLRGQVHSYLWNAFSTWDADLSAKAVFQAMHPRCLPRRLRGKVHSYLWNAFQRGMRTCPRRRRLQRCISRLPVTGKLPRLIPSSPRRVVCLP